MTKGRKVFFVSLIILTATILRFFQISETVPFLGDQGRDLIEVREALLARRLPLVGPLSNEGIHAGPFYYYLIIPPLIINLFHPIGPILFFTFLGVISTFLIYHLSLNLFGLFPSLVAAALYASSPLVINRTSGLWNPIPVPFFSLLILLALFQIQEKRQWKWFIPLGMFLGIAIQLYMPAYFLFLPVAGWWFYLFLKRAKEARKITFLKWSIIGFLFFLLALLPFLIFEIQHEFIDIKNLLLLFGGKFLSLSSVTKTETSFPAFLKIFSQQFQALIPSTLPQLSLLLGLAILSCPFLAKRKSKLFWHNFLSFWFLGGIFVLTVYPEAVIHHHYACFIWPLPFLLFASSIKFLEKSFPKKILFGLAIFLVLLNLKVYFTSLSPTHDLTRTEMTAERILQKAKNQPFSILLLSPRSPSDAHLRYFLSLKGGNIKSIKDKSVPLLFLICTQTNCPTPEIVQKLEVVESECLPICPLLEEQKTVKLRNWQFLSKEDIFEGQLYFFQNPNQ